MTSDEQLKHYRSLLGAAAQFAGVGQPNEALGRTRVVVRELNALTEQMAAEGEVPRWLIELREEADRSLQGYKRQWQQWQRENAERQARYRERERRVYQEPLPQTDKSSARSRANAS